MSITGEPFPQSRRRRQPSDAELDRLNRETMQRMASTGTPGMLFHRPGSTLLGLSQEQLAAATFGALLFGTAMIAPIAGPPPEDDSPPADA